MEQQASPNTNVDRLKAAGLIRDETMLASDHLAILESLTTEEVTQLIALRDRLGVDFVEAHSKPSASFIF